MSRYLCYEKFFKKKNFFRTILLQMYGEAYVSALQVRASITIQRILLRHWEVWDH
jgi:hypothetical protein